MHVYTSLFLKMNYVPSSKRRRIIEMKSPASSSSGPMVLRANGQSEAGPSYLALSAYYDISSDCVEGAKTEEYLIRVGACVSGVDGNGTTFSYIYDVNLTTIQLGNNTTKTTITHDYSEFGNSECIGVSTGCGQSSVGSCSSGSAVAGDCDVPGGDVALLVDIGYGPLPPLSTSLSYISTSYDTVENCLARNATGVIAAQGYSFACGQLRDIDQCESHRLHAACREAPITDVHCDAVRRAFLNDGGTDTGFDSATGGCKECFYSKGWALSLRCEICPPHSSATYGDTTCTCNAGFRNAGLSDPTHRHVSSF